MTATSTALKQIFDAGRPLIQQWLEIGVQIAALRDAATEKGLDWSQVKGLLKAQVQDEMDGDGEGKRVKRIVERAEYASSYADMLGLANMNEKNFSAGGVASTPAGSGSGVNAATGAPAAPIGSSGTGHPFAVAGKPLTDETSDAGSVSVGLSTAKSDDLAEIQPRPVPECAAVQVEGAFPVSAPSTDLKDMEIPAFLDRRNGSGGTTGKATQTSGVISGLSCLPSQEGASQ